MMRWPVPVLALLLAACAGPFSVRDVDMTLTPLQALADADAARGRAVIWGGVIVATENLADATRIELLTYPLDGSQRPATDRDTLGRVRLYYRGFLEPVDYAPGRRLTVQGWLAGTEQGRVDRHPYTFPVLRVGQLHLWPRRHDGGEPRVHFGIGVGFGL